jgi:hypothetical protein
MKTTMNSIRVLTTREAGEWLQVLEPCAPFDFYHLPQYHTLAEELGEGAARLFLYTEAEYTIALPLLLRSLDGIPLSRSATAGLRDATSVYGYAGPVCSHAEVPKAVIHRFQSALENLLRDLQVVTVFSRLHPFLPQLALLAGLGQCKTWCRTVSIDLTLPPEVQRAQYRRAYRKRINKLRSLGVTCSYAQDRSSLAEFAHIYHETMRRVQAAEKYFFPLSYFERLYDRLDAHLFVCRHEGRMISGGLFIACRDILQCHLGGTLDDALPMAPAKLMIDEARLWGTARKFRILHLGGGVTADPEDSLLHFKMGFSEHTHEFAVWRWVLFPEIHQRLCKKKTRWNERHRLRPVNTHYFPEYRCPTVPIVPAAASAPLPAPCAARQGRR